MNHKMYINVCARVGGTKNPLRLSEGLFKLLSHSHTDADTHTRLSMKYCISHKYEVNQTCVFFHMNHKVLLLVFNIHSMFPTCQSTLDKMLKNFPCGL